MQKSITFLFTTFDRTGSATATMKAFRKNELLFPRRVRKGPQKGELIWEPLNHQRVLQVVTTRAMREPSCGDDAKGVGCPMGTPL